MPGSDVGEVITLDSSSEDEEGDVGELFEETLGKRQKKKKSQHKRFVSDSSNDKGDRKSRFVTLILPSDCTHLYFRFQFLRRI
jgi:hypothetical protein